MAKRKNETLTDFTLLNFLKEHKVFSNNWTVKKVPNNIAIQECLDKSSKSGTNERGEPDLIYINEHKKLLILIENKDLIKDHQSKDGKNAKGYTVDGIKHYLGYFTDENLKNRTETTKKYLKEWKIVGIAFSGDIYDDYNHLITTFIVSDNKIVNILPLIQETIVRYATENNIGYWDLFGDTGGSASCQQWKKNGLMQADGIHLTSKGYQHYGQLLFLAWTHR